jgi:hypothetical protein
VDAIQLSDGHGAVHGRVSETASLSLATNSCTLTLQTDLDSVSAESTLSRALVAIANDSSPWWQCLGVQHRTYRRQMCQPRQVLGPPRTDDGNREDHSLVGLHAVVSRAVCILSMPCLMILSDRPGRMSRKGSGEDPAALSERLLWCHQTAS